MVFHFTFIHGPALTLQQELIVSLLLKHTSDEGTEQYPHFPVSVIVATLRVLLDGFLDRSVKFTLFHSIIPHFKHGCCFQPGDDKRTRG